mmetsp:Transcript_46118/g.72181  ORF Transcript_46118/g.72181 Transcript_46118/m.72181 type:complete len:347 (+) Transcript_46118:154-1194(+)
MCRARQPEEEEMHDFPAHKPLGGSGFSRTVSCPVPSNHIAGPKDMIRFRRQSHVPNQIPQPPAARPEPILEDDGFVCCGGHAKLAERPQRKVAEVHYPKPSPRKRSVVKQRPETARTRPSPKHEAPVLHRRRSSLQDSQDTQLWRQSLLQDSVEEMAQDEQGEAAEDVELVQFASLSLSSLGHGRDLPALVHSGSMPTHSNKNLSRAEMSYYLRGGQDLPSNKELSQKKDRTGLSIKTDSLSSNKFLSSPKPRYLPGQGMCWIQNDKFGNVAKVHGLCRDLPNGPVVKPIVPKSPVRAPTEKKLRPAALDIIMAQRMMDDEAQRCRRRRIRMHMNRAGCDMHSVKH